MNFSYLISKKATIHLIVTTVPPDINLVTTADYTGAVQPLQVYLRRFFMFPARHTCMIAEYLWWLWLLMTIVMTHLMP